MRRRITQSIGSLWHSTAKSGEPGVLSFSSSSVSEKLKDVPNLRDFMASKGRASRMEDTEAPDPRSGPSVFVETYGCQMNSSDSEIVLGILSQNGYHQASKPDQADVILINTCAIREGAEQRIWGRLGVFKGHKLLVKKEGKEPPVVGVLGCMAERLKTKLLESDRLVDIVAGPDAYRDLPRLIQAVRGHSLPSTTSDSPDSPLSIHDEDESGSLPRSQTSLHASTSISAAPRPKPKPSRRQQAINVQLSVDETYADVTPVRSSGKVGAFLSIMRGCSNLCSFCIVPYTRGRERSRPLPSILEEVKRLAGEGVKEITLLGQNVNSYADRSHLGEDEVKEQKKQPLEDPFSQFYAKGFTSVYKPDRRGAVTFAELLLRCSEVDPEVRLRFTSPHPKDFCDDVLSVVKSRPNVCKQLHMPVQSGSTRMLERMRRGYTREHYLDLVEKIRREIPGVALSTDVIAGFCGESESDHRDTVRLMEHVRYENAFLFAYSKRDKTHAARHYEDDVPEDVKLTRLRELMEVYRVGFEASQQQEVGRTHLILIEGASPKGDHEWIGKTDTMKKVLIPNVPVPASLGDVHGPKVDVKVGDYVAVEIERVRAGVTLGGKALGRTTMQEFYSRARY